MQLLTSASCYSGSLGFGSAAALFFLLTVFMFWLLL